MNILRGLAAACFVLLLGAAASLAEQEPDKVDVQEGLVLHYTFESHEAQLVPNELGKHRTGRGKAATFAESLSGGHALLVRKSNDPSGYIETASDDDLNSPQFTIAAWVKLRRAESTGSVVCKHDWTDGSARGFVLRCYSAEHVNFTIGAGGWTSTDGTSRMPANRWIHVAGTFDGTHMRVYVDGELEGTKEVIHEYTPSPLPLRVGNATFVSERKRKFDGQIDEVMFWTRALSDEELQSLFEDQKKSRPPPLTPKTIAPLIAELAGKKFKGRNSAERRLLELDTEVLPLIKPHIERGEPEVVWRLKRVEKMIQRDLAD